MWVDVGTSERFRPLGRFRRGTKTEHALPHLPHPQPLGARLKKKRQCKLDGIFVLPTRK